ncbi:MAG: DUF5666 domain-containing protein [Candidatus Andersenbacteria bacterium]|nr:DUF5666 domain-containing protein [Candidatus Andersenbacteria bacterium]
MNTKATIIIAVVLALIVGFGGGYYVRGAMRPQGVSRNAIFTPGQGGATGTRFGGANAQGRPVEGTIDSITSDHMTVKSPDGSTHAVLIDNTTQYKKTTDATQADFTQGTSVMVIGKQNPDGSITASSIQTAPQRPASQSPAPAAQ